MPTNPRLRTPSRYENYGQYNTNPTSEQLLEHFHLNDQDLILIETCRNAQTKLGMALQLCTLRFLGTFLTDPTNVPSVVVANLERQLGFENVNLEHYRNRKDARLEHQERLLEHLGYQNFTAIESQQIFELLLAKFLVAEENTGVLFDFVTTELTEQNIVLPAASTIQKLITKAREQANTRLHQQLAEKLSKTQTQKLEQLLLVPKDQYRTRFEQLRAQPIQSTATSLEEALNRVDELRSIGISRVNLDDVAENRLAPMLRLGLSIWAGTLEKYSRNRRLATLLVLFQHLERDAVDDALTVFDQLMQKTGLGAQRKLRKERLRTLNDLDAAALTLRDVVRLILDSSIAPGKIRKRALEQFGEAKLLHAITQVSELTSHAGDEEAEVWESTHRSVAGFIMPLLNTIEFEGAANVKHLLEAIKFVKRTSSTAKNSWGEPPRAFIPKSWLPMIFPAGKTALFVRSKYIVCVAHLLHKALKRGDVFVSQSNRHNDPRARLLEGDAWEAVKHDVYRTLNLPLKAAEMIDRLGKSLDATYKTVIKNLPNNPALTFKKIKDVMTPALADFEALPEPETLIELGKQIQNRLPEINLTELLLEINARTGFAREMLSHTASLMGSSPQETVDLETSLIAVLVAEACNIGLPAVTDEKNPALKASRLSWVKQTYLQADVITHGNAKLVDYHSGLPVVQHWGGGEIASSDGQRFVVPVKSLYSGPNSKYFGSKRGITYYTLISDQFTQLHGQVISGTVKDSLFILANLLEQITGMKPTEVMSDTGGYSDVIFGLFHLLGFKFSPRLKDLKKLRYWRINARANYAEFEEISQNKISTVRIVDHWDDIVRLVGSLKLGKVKAPDILRVLARDGKLGGLGNAVAEIGRVAKTMFLLEYHNDEGYRRKITAQLNRGESRHSLVEAVLHGEKGEIRKHYKRGMESQLGALGFVVNTIILWNTEYVGAILGLLEAMGVDVLEEDVARVSPVRWAHVNMLGRYEFSMDPVVAGGDLRPLRDPDSVRFLDSDS